MSENTTKGEIMDKERIAATIAKYRDPHQWSQNIDHHPEGSAAYVALELLAVVDAIQSGIAARVGDSIAGDVQALQVKLDEANATLSAARERIREMEAGVVPELTEALLDEIAGPWLPDRDPMCTRRAERRVGVRDAWAKIRALGAEVQRPGWSILSEETHELRSYTWRDDHDRLIEGCGLYAVGASEGSVPFQRYRARPSSRVAGEGQTLVDGAELAALRNLFAACGNAIHAASGGHGASLVEINEAWAGVCAAQVIRATPDPAP